MLILFLFYQCIVCHRQSEYNLFSNLPLEYIDCFQFYIINKVVMYIISYPLPLFAKRYFLWKSVSVAVSLSL